LSKLVALAAGGTGGHLFPAQALAEALTARGAGVHLLTDERVRDYGKNFPALAVHEVPSATLSLSQPLKVPARVARLLGGFLKARRILRQVKPSVMVGFGGYPSLPPLLAAASLGIPVVIHEQNAVMGRANRLLARFAKVIASSFPAIANHAGAVSFTGNPVRAAVKARAGAAYEAPGEVFNLLVFGGSQGARFFGDFMPGAIAALSDHDRRGLKINQQCRPEDLERVGAAYAKLGVAHELNHFFGDMPERMAAAHLVIGRAGASTVAELGVVGRPALLVPLPHSLENDQLRNAESFAGAGAAWIIAQSELTPARFAAFFSPLRQSPTELARAAAAAVQSGVPDAAERLADLVLRVAR
jgi:UDP-N-acetylglucosamine--N-acetylmuramyl-(pentapeptide) pyrophosphoryl-undecaprenol N-acetylglucosamine transferase